MKKQYQHFCPVARTLEVVGEKWSLLIVRDLLRGSQRFTDLQRYLLGITPRRLSERLKELEEQRIVQREEGKREVWYSLTPRGEDLRNVVESLLLWGIRYALGPSRRGETIYPEQTLYALSVWLNNNAKQLKHPRSWLLRWGANDSWALVFDGRRWLPAKHAEKADLVLETTPQDWIAFLTAPASRRARLVKKIKIEGKPERKREFLNSMLIFR